MATHSPAISSFLGGLYEKYACFAVLHPFNADAVVAFSQVCDRIDTDPTGFAKPAKFTARDSRMPFAQACERARTLTQASSQTTFRDVDTSFSTDTTVFDDQHDPNELVHTGCFIFSCDIAPEMRRLGWRAGAAYHPGSHTKHLDLLLTTKKSHRVRGTHAILNWLHDSGAFGIRGRHDSDMPTYGRVSLSKAEGFIVVNAFDEVVTIGNLTYRLIYTVPPHFEDEFQRKKARYMTDVLHLERPIISATVTPSALDIRLGHWTLLKTAGKGSQSVIQAARSDRNELVAVKHFVRRDASSARTIEEEIRQYEDFKQRISCQHVLTLQDIIFTGRSRDFRSVPGDADDVYVLFAPLVRGTFRSHILHTEEDLSEEVKLELFAQAAVGVAAIHRAGYVHRDIKPENLGVLSIQKPFTVILDLGQVVYTPYDRQTGIPSTPGRGGTVGYHAPEMEREHQVYGQPVDMFALGCVGFEMFTNGGQLIGSAFNPFREPIANIPAATKHAVTCANTRYRQALQISRDCRPESIEGLLARLLEESPAQRLTAEQTLEHPVIMESLRRVSGDEGSSTTSRKRRTSDDATEL